MQLRGERAELDKLSESDSAAPRSDTNAGVASVAKGAAHAGHGGVPATAELQPNFCTSSPPIPVFDSTS
jgi:hypothetical protein